jgi:hypothetical protein
MTHGRRTFGTRALALAIAGVSAVIVIGGVSASAAVSGANAARPRLVVGPGVRGLSVSSGPLAPGDTVQRTAVLMNGGNTVMHAVWATINPSAASPPPASLQFRVDSCPVAWTRSGSALVCRRARVRLAPWQTLKGQPVNLLRGAGMQPGAALRLRVSVRLPVSLGAASAGKAGAITWTFTAG